MRWMQQQSIAELAERRGARRRRGARASPTSSSSTAAAPARSRAPRAEPSVTEIAAGSGLFGRHLFDNYRTSRPAPAAAFALPVVRKPTPEIATLLGGGWIASGPPGADRLPQLVWPEGLTMVPREMAGEVQTPLTGQPPRAPAASATGCGCGTPRRASSAEHVNEFALVDGDARRRHAAHLPRRGKGVPVTATSRRRRASLAQLGAQRERRRPQLRRDARRSVDAVQRARRAAAARAGLPVKAVGAGHSFTGIAVAPGVQLDLAGLDGVLAVDAARGRVTLAAGTQPVPAARAARPATGSRCENMGDIDRQTIAGATSTGTHGTGGALRRPRHPDRRAHAGHRPTARLLTHQRDRERRAAAGRAARARRARRHRRRDDAVRARLPAAGRRAAGAARRRARRASRSASAPSTTSSSTGSRTPRRR